ncbi:hypothetical protein H4S02_012652, partial [Coemansia sp. RSA 2611]
QPHAGGGRAARRGGGVLRGGAARVGRRARGADDGRGVRAAAAERVRVPDGPAGGDARVRRRRHRHGAAHRLPRRRVPVAGGGRARVRRRARAPAGVLLERVGPPVHRRAGAGPAGAGPVGRVPLPRVPHARHVPLHGAARGRRGRGGGCVPRTGRVPPRGRRRVLGGDVAVRAAGRRDAQPLGAGGRRRAAPRRVLRRPACLGPPPAPVARRVARRVARPDEPPGAACPARPCRRRAPAPGCRVARRPGRRVAGADAAAAADAGHAAGGRAPVPRVAHDGGRLVAGGRLCHVRHDAAARAPRGAGPGRRPGRRPAGHGHRAAREPRRDAGRGARPAERPGLRAGAGLPARAHGHVDRLCAGAGDRRPLRGHLPRRRRPCRAGRRPRAPGLR